MTANGRRRLSAITGGVGPSWSALPAVLPVHRDVSQSQEGNPGGLPWTPVSQGQVVEKAVAVGHAALHSSRAVCWFSKETAAEERLLPRCAAGFTWRGRGVRHAFQPSFVWDSGSHPWVSVPVCIYHETYMRVDSWVPYLFESGLFRDY